MPLTGPITALRVTAAADESVVVLADGEFRIPWAECSPRLAASPEERACAELSPGGYGIHWPLLDEDMSINGLVRRKD